MPNKDSFITPEKYLEYYREYRRKNREKLRKYGREYNKEWRKNNGYHNEEKWIDNNPKKRKAQELLRYAVRKGMVEKKNCETQDCESDKTQGHHEDYSKPLEVKWLCAKHHKQLHIDKKICQTT